MSLHRRAAKRDTAEPAIIARLELLGASVEPLSGHRIPDLLVGWKGLTRLAEVKTPGAKATGKVMRATKAGQEDFARRWRGSPVAILTTPDEAATWLLSLSAAAQREAHVFNRHHETMKALEDA